MLVGSNNTCIGIGAAMTQGGVHLFLCGYCGYNVIGIAVAVGQALAHIVGDFFRVVQRPYMDIGGGGCGLQDGRPSCGRHYTRLEFNGDGATVGTDNGRVIG